MKNWKEKWNMSDAISYLIQESKKRSSGLSWIGMVLDACLCFVLYRSTFHDYINLRFYEKKADERETFLTTEMVKAEKKKWNKRDVNRVDDKGLFNSEFSRYVSRDWIDLDKVSKKDIDSFLNGKTICFVKPKRESSGIGVQKIQVSDIVDVSAFIKRHQGCLLEDPVVICSELKQLNPQSMSQIRVVTVVNGDEVNILAATLRSGCNCEFNTAKNDLFAHVDIMTGKVYTNGIDEAGKWYERHPVSGVPFVGFQIPCWDEIIRTCVEAAKVIPEVKVVGWDVAVTEDHGVTFFEGNPGSGVTSMQIADKIGKKDLFYQYLES